MSEHVLRRATVNLATFIFAMMVCSVTFAEQNDQADAAAEGPVFVPPEIGAPADRLGAGTRDIIGTTEGLLLLAPEGGGLTTSGTPPLIWYLSEGFDGTMTTQISAPSASGVVLEWDSLLPKGYYSLDLRRSGFRLQEGVIYVWKVMLIKGDTVIAVAESFVERVRPTDRSPGQAGIWFDVLSPLVSTDLSGRARVQDNTALNQLLNAGGVVE